MTDDEKKKKMEAFTQQAFDEVMGAIQGRPPTEGSKAAVLEAALAPLIEKRKARAQLLNEAIALVVPMLKGGVPIGVHQSMWEIPRRFDANFGAAAVTEAEQPWLKLGAQHVAGTPDLIGLDRDHQTGPALVIELYVLEDGRLAETTRVGQWERTSGPRPTAAALTLVRACILTAEEALSRWDLGELLAGLSDYPVAYDDSDAVRADRDAKFRAALARVASA